MACSGSTPALARRFSPRLRFGIISKSEGEEIKPRLYILAGANGSGKSTMSKVLLPADGIVYVNGYGTAVFSDSLLRLIKVGLCRK